MGYRGASDRVVSFFALSSVSNVHLIQFAAGRCDLLDAELAKLSLELTELLDQIFLALVPELTGLDL